MLSRVSGRSIRMAKRFQSHAPAAEKSAAPFNNKYNFNINPPPIHTYWNARNFSVSLAFAPLFVAVGFIGIYIGSNMSGYEGLIRFADSPNSPLKDLKFGEPQGKKQ